MYPNSARLFAALLPIVFLSAPLNAQPKMSVVKGTVIVERELILRGYVVELTDLLKAGEVMHAEVMGDGAFILHNVPFGDYVLRLTNYYGTVLSEQFVAVRDSAAPVEIRVTKANEARPASGPVSLRELQHPPARKAFAATVSGQKFAQSGNYEKAADELRKAIRISPDYAAAHSNLAVQYIRLNRYQEALEEIGRAMELAGPNPGDLCNLAYVRSALEQYDDGAAAAREALRLDPNYAAAHYILGTLLLLHPEARPEAVQHLRRAAETMQGARDSLARIGAAEQR